MKDSANQEIVNTRTFAAPRERVFHAFSDPAQLAQWWGPKGFTNTIHQFDFKPGGDWRLTMHSPAGTDYHNHSQFTEIVQLERIVFQHKEPVHRFQMTMTFAEQAGGTKLTWRMLFESADEAAKMKNFIADANEQNFDRLETHLTRMASTLKTNPMTAKQNPPASAALPPFVITRTFNAPRSLVFKAWTERERLMQWCGPKGTTMTTAKMDLRPGGLFHYCLRSPDGKEMWGKWVFREINAPERIVAVSSFSDEKGGITTHPMSPTWPREMLSTTTFSEKDGKTTITLQWEPLNPTEAEHQTFEDGRQGMTMGWAGAFDILDQYLATAK